MKVLGLTISREGSKRIPRKNMKTICGKPLLEWTLIQLSSSKYVEGKWLVTDSEEQAKLAETYGFKIAWQDTKDIDAREVEGAGKMGGPYAMRIGVDAAQKDAGALPYNVIIPILPTQFLRKPDDIDNAIDYWLAHQEVPLCGGSNFLDMMLYERNDKGICVPVVFDNTHKYWELHGCIWVGRPEQYIDAQFSKAGVALQFEDTVKANRYQVFPMEHWQRYDLDYPEEWELSEILLEHKILRGNPNVYQDYKKRVLSEYGYEQHASAYNKGVEQNLLPAEYRNSFFNHLPVYLETMKAPENIVGWELNEIVADATTKELKRNRMKLIKARNATDIFDEANVLKEPQPALIIGSGPSLDEALPLVKDWKGAVFCSTSHASSLIYHGCEPSHMIAYDINTRPEEQNWVDTWNGRKTVMVTHPGMFPATLDSWPGKRIYFKSMDTSNFFFTNVLPVAYGDVIPSHMFLFSCSVSAQMSIAHAMGYSPLFFVGCDFAAARFRKWVYDHKKNEWVCDPEVQLSLGNYITSANGIKTDALQSFYKRSVICVWRIDRSACIQTSNSSILTELPYVPIKDVIASGGRGFESKVLSAQEADDVAEKYLARFNQYILQFDPDKNGKVSYRVLESHAGKDWELDVARYLLQMKADLKAKGMALDINVDKNMARFKWLKDAIRYDDGAECGDGVNYHTPYFPGIHNPPKAG